MQGVQMFRCCLPVVIIRMINTLIILTTVVHSKVRQLYPLNNQGSDLESALRWASASWVAQWLRALYCSASCATRDSRFAPRLCHNRPRPGGPWGDAQLA